MLVHCNLKFRPAEIQFLYNTEHFTHRRLEIGTCPVCNKLLARLVEKRVLDGKWFDTVEQKVKAEKLIKANENDIEYTSLKVDNYKKTPFGFRYGVNTEKVNKNTGEVTITQKSCDFFGNKETVKVYKS